MIHVQNFQSSYSYCDRYNGDAVSGGVRGGNKNNQTSPTPEQTATSTPTLTASGPNLSKEVKLKMYMVGDPAPGHTDVVDAINKITKEKLNATADIENIPWASLGQKYLLIFSANEDFDGVYTTNWNGVRRHWSDPQSEGNQWRNPAR